MMVGVLSPRSMVTAGLDFDLPVGLDLLSHFSCSEGGDYSGVGKYGHRD